MTPVDPIAPVAGTSRQGRRARVGMFLFFLVFFLIGLGITYGLFVRPWLRARAARDWAAVPCTIIDSEVITHDTDDGHTYAIHVVYDYYVKDHKHTGTRYDFTIGSDSGYESKRAIVERLPPGTRTVCYVNPANADDAVLARDFGAKWFILIPGVFVAFGLAGMIGSVVLRGTSSGDPSRAALSGAAVRPSPASAAWLGPGATSPRANVPVSPAKRTNVPAFVRTAPHSRQPVTLKPMSGRVAPLVFISVFAAFWNGVIWPVAIHAWTGRRPDLCAGLFFIPFLLAGLGMLAAVAFMALKLLNPRVQVVLSRGLLVPGETAEVNWAFTGRTDRITKLTVAVIGREEAVYRRGTTTATDRNVFATLPVIETTQAVQIRAGRGGFTLPADTMHTFLASHNKVLWILKIHGEIPRWPDVDEEFAITVVPAGAPEAQG